MTEALHVRTVTPEDRDAWLRMRFGLWKDHPVDELTKEVDEYLRGDASGAFGADSMPKTVLVAERGRGRVVGFAEVDLRERADGCPTHPVGYMEGWYVVAEERRRGVGRALFRAAEQWARDQGCSEMASDTMVGNDLGERAHKALGYEEVDRLILFRKNLP